MLDRMKTLLRESSMCVLATCSGNVPHCSLMNYITDDGGATVYTVTLKTSRKYANILQNHRVSLLVDSRVDDRCRAGAIKALTVAGTSALLTDKADKDLILTRIVQRHPHLKDLAFHPDAEVLAIRVESFLLLEGPTQAHFVEAREPG